MLNTKMTLEEAKKAFDSFGKTFTLDEAREDVHVLLETIYSGFTRSCDTCVYSKPVMEGQPTEYLVCERGCFDPIEDDFECADFELDEYKRFFKKAKNVNLAGSFNISDRQKELETKDRETMLSFDELQELMELKEKRGNT